jgi:replicative DNA helicase
MVNTDIASLKRRIRKLKDRKILILDKKSESMVHDMNRESEAYRQGKVKKRKIATHYFQACLILW